MIPHPRTADRTPWFPGVYWVDDFAERHWAGGPFLPRPTGDQKDRIATLCDDLIFKTLRRLDGMDN